MSEFCQVRPRARQVSLLGTRSGLATSPASSRHCSSQNKTKYKGKCQNSKCKSKKLKIWNRQNNLHQTEILWKLKWYILVDQLKYLTPASSTALYFISRREFKILFKCWSESKIIFISHYRQYSIMRGNKKEKATQAVMQGDHSEFMEIPMWWISELVW